MKKIGYEKLYLWLSSIRDGFITLLPLTFFRALAELIHSFPWQGYHNWMTNLFGESWEVYLNRIIDSTNYGFGLALAVLVAVHLIRRLPEKKDHQEIPPLTVGVSALINFMIFAFTLSISDEILGFKSIFLGAIVGILTAELLRKIAYLRIFHFFRMPYEAEANFFYATWLAPSIIVVGVISLVIAQVSVNLPTSPQNILVPLSNWLAHQPLAIWMFNLLATFINQISWAIGFHGGLILDSYASNLFLPTGFPSDGIHVQRPVFDIFILLGGSGATIGLIIAIFLISKDGYQRKVGQLSVIPSIFNINDPLLYGLPIILNPRYLLPFIGVPIVLTILTVAAIETGFITTTNEHLPWTTPIFISGWLITESWHGVALQVLAVIISTVTYMPFVKKVEGLRIQKEEANFKSAVDAIISARTARLTSYKRQDNIGIIARGLLTDLRNDLSTENLFLMYQPKHNKSGQVVGVEALLRWSHFKYGQISPEIAVTLAEDSGDINRLGIKVIEESFACKKRWNQMGYKSLTMAINVSPQQLETAELVEAIEVNLAKYQLQPEEIELEITESSVLPDNDATHTALSKLSEIGVRLAIDDFGMGYASLRYINRFPVKVIKIDGSLTQDVLENDVKADIIKSIATLGNSQHLEIVAEYVEDIAQKEALEQIGCNIFQGYLFSQPLSESDCIAYFSKHVETKVIN